ncbi:hypothetical protein UCREL1_5867 [Eutypa lata UCREL1]|uniref:Uncharacterized protein n=1 Tax=Eutypa lata (strain UCR-EL1) TaxID=1287681 RepID=M7TKB4_EUTLA|nr:hypothetical protein UCREL1_5867 [Eutypa lata UCREL1]
MFLQLQWADRHPDADLYGFRGFNKGSGDLFSYVRGRDRVSSLYNLYSIFNFVKKFFIHHTSLILHSIILNPIVRDLVIFNFVVLNSIYDFIIKSLCDLIFNFLVVILLNFDSFVDTFIFVSFVFECLLVDRQLIFDCLFINHQLIFNNYSNNSYAFTSTVPAQVYTTPTVTGPCPVYTTVTTTYIPTTDNYPSLTTTTDSEPYAPTETVYVETPFCGLYGSTSATQYGSVNYFYSLSSCRSDSKSRGYRYIAWDEANHICHYWMDDPRPSFVEDSTSALVFYGTACGNL